MPPKVGEYTILKQRTAQKMAEEVTSMLREGWELSGQLFTHRMEDDDYFYQPMTRSFEAMPEFPRREGKPSPEPPKLTLPPKRLT